MEDMITIADLETRIEELEKEAQEHSRLGLLAFDLANEAATRETSEILMEQAQQHSNIVGEIRDRVEAIHHTIAQMCANRQV